MSRNAIRLAAGIAVLSIAAGSGFAANPKVGGAAMYEDKNIVENAVNSKDHTTLVAAVKAAGLVETLEGKGRSPCLRQPTKPSQPCRKVRSTTF